MRCGVLFCSVLFLFWPGSFVFGVARASGLRLNLEVFPLPGLHVCPEATNLQVSKHTFDEAVCERTSVDRAESVVGGVEVPLAADRGAKAAGIVVDQYSYIRTRQNKVQVAWMPVRILPPMTRSLARYRTALDAKYIQLGKYSCALPTSNTVLDESKQKKKPSRGRPVHDARPGPGLLRMYLAAR